MRAPVAISASVAAGRDLGDKDFDGEWQASSAALMPYSLREAARDLRWESMCAIARIGSQPVGLLPIYRRKGSAFPAAFADPAKVAPGIFPCAIAASQYALIGGASDMVAGPAVSRVLSDDMAAAAKRSLVDAAYQWSEASGLVGAALYVRQQDLTAFVGASGLARRSQAVDELSVLRLPSGGWEGYLASLDHKRRSVVKRDLAKLTDLKLALRVTPASDIIAESLPLVRSIKERHGVPEHADLLEARLSDWAANRVGERIAFTARDSSSRLIAVSFGCLYGGVLEMCEIGLTDDPSVRQLVYVEVMLYSPIRLAAAIGCEEITLGLGSVIPKKLRGATVTNVWAVGADAK